MIAVLSGTAPAGVRVLIATRPVDFRRGADGLHAKALHGCPFDGHTLGPVIAELEALTGIDTRAAFTSTKAIVRKQRYVIWPFVLRETLEPLSRSLGKIAIGSPLKPTAENLHQI
jgi:hypothetical protein